MEETKVLRKHYVIKRGFQLRYGLYMVAFLLYGVLLVWFETFSTLKSVFIDSGLYNEQMQQLMNAIRGTLLVKILLGVILALVLAVLLSHFIAGPLYRIEKAMESVKNGDLAVRVNLRKWDEFKNLKEKITSMFQNSILLLIKFTFLMVII